MPSNLTSSVLSPDTLSQHLSVLLTDRGQSVAVAESCTGGRISAALTARPGASAFFLEGACVYSNAAKMRTCGVSKESLAAHGAVSEAVARQLAVGIRERAQSTYGIGVTGIAGPSGGRPDKPVGTVHIGLTTPTGCTHLSLSLGALPREQILSLSTSMALDLLWRHLKAL
jgi:nicotinamide-nucleotide amidase